MKPVPSFLSHYDARCFLGYMNKSIEYLEVAIRILPEKTPAFYKDSELKEINRRIKLIKNRAEKIIRKAESFKKIEVQSVIDIAKVLRPRLIDLVSNDDLEEKEDDQ